MAVLAEPLREPEHQIEAEVLGLAREARVVVEAPVGRARQRGHRPAAALDRQEQAEHQRLFECARQRAIGEFGG
jgi:hypothetical protein